MNRVTGQRSSRQLFYRLFFLHCGLMGKNACWARWVFGCSTSSGHWDRTFSMFSSRPSAVNCCLSSRLLLLGTDDQLLGTGRTERLDFIPPDPPTERGRAKQRVVIKKQSVKSVYSWLHFQALSQTTESWSNYWTAAHQNQISLAHFYRLALLNFRSDDGDVDTAAATLLSSPLWAARRRRRTRSKGARSSYRKCSAALQLIRFNVNQAAASWNKSLTTSAEEESRWKSTLVSCCAGRANGGEREREQEREQERESVNEPVVRNN